MAKDREQISKVHNARASVASTFRTKFEQMTENSRFYRLLQYSSDQLKKMARENRVPYAMDYITTALNTIMGDHEQEPTDIYYKPTAGEDELRVEVLNAVAGAVLKQNKFRFLETDIFLDGLVQKVGGNCYEWSREKNKNGTLKIFKIQPRQIMWDLNRTDASIDSATWVSRQRLFGKRELINRRPDLKRVIEKMSFTMEELEDLGVYSKDYINQVLEEDLGAVALIEFFEKNYRIRYFIKTIGEDGEYVDPIYFDTQKDADKEIKDRLQRFEQEISPQFTQAGIIPPPPPRYESFPDTTPVIQKTEVAHNVLISPTEDIDEPFFPLDVFHPYFHDGDWWGHLDSMKDPQRYMNKMFSMLDHWLGVMAKGLLLIDDKVPEAEANRVIEMFGKTGGGMRVSDVELYKLIESKGPAPQLFSMVDLVRQILEDKSGGRNYQGKKETASESGIAVRLRIQRGSLSSKIMFTNLERWKQSVGEKVAWYLTHYLTYPETLRLEGEELVQQTKDKLNPSNDPKGWFRASDIQPGVGYLEINTTKQNTIEDLRVDVIVSEARDSSTKNEIALGSIALAIQSSPVLAETFPPSTLIRLMPLPYTEKQKAIEISDQLLQAKIERERAAVTKPPTLSASLSDVKDLPPVAAAQLLAMFGIKIDPSEFGANGKGLKEMMDIQLAQAKTAQEMEIKRERHEQEMGIKMAKAEADIGMKIAQADARIKGERDAH